MKAISAILFAEREEEGKKKSVSSAETALGGQVCLCD